MMIVTCDRNLINRFKIYQIYLLTWNFSSYETPPKNRFLFRPSLFRPSHSNPFIAKRRKNFLHDAHYSLFYPLFYPLFYSLFYSFFYSKTSI